VSSGSAAAWSNQAPASGSGWVHPARSARLSHPARSARLSHPARSARLSHPAHPARLSHPARRARSARPAERASTIRLHRRIPTSEEEKARRSPVRRLAELLHRSKLLTSYNVSIEAANFSQNGLWCHRH